MDTAALIPSKKRKRKRVRSILNYRHLPADILEEILLKLPHKSLVRFSSVSKSWNSMIFDPVFARKHKNRAVLLCQNRLVVYMNDWKEKIASLCCLPPISSDLRVKVMMAPHRSRDDSDFFDPVYSNTKHRVKVMMTPPRSRDDSDSFVSVFFNTNIDARDFAGQFEGNPYLRAFCDELWCVQVKKHLFLWNPSIRSFVKLPKTIYGRDYGGGGYYIYGLAYDSINDDYKILKITRHSPYRTELYSLKDNCWRNIEPSSDVKPSFSQQRCEFVEGRLHWIGYTTARARIIVSFDLSTEKYGEVAQPKYEPELNINFNNLKVVALKGMLCASVNYTDEDEGRFVLWAMEEYGVEKSWTKRFDIPFSSYRLTHLTPFYWSDNNDILVKSKRSTTYYMHIILFRNGEAKPKEIATCSNHSHNVFYKDVFFYVESLITHNNFSKNR